MVARSLCSLFGLFFVLVTDSALPAQVEQGVDKDHMSGVVEAHLASFEAWRTADFLIRVQSSGNGRYYRLEDNEGIGSDSKLKFVEGPDSSELLVESNSLYRVKFDFDTNRCLIVTKLRETLSVFNSLGDVVSSSVKEDSTAFLLCDPEKGVLAVGPKGDLYKSDKVASTERALSISYIPDIRMLGWKEVYPWSSERVHNQLLNTASPDKMLELSHVGRNRYQIKRETAIDGIFATCQWDLVRNVPVRFWFGHESGEVILSEGSAEWKAMDGLYLPVSSRYMKSLGRTLGGRDYSTKNEVEIDIHWFSFNEELGADLFQEELLRDRKKLDELLSPEVFDKKSDSVIGR